jgi:hypothetical protein
MSLGNSHRGEWMTKQLGRRDAWLSLKLADMLECLRTESWIEITLMPEYVQWWKISIT